MADRVFVMIIEEDGNPVVGQIIEDESTRPGGAPVIRTVPTKVVIDMLNRNLRLVDELQVELDKLKPKGRA